MSPVPRLRPKDTSPLPARWRRPRPTVGSPSADATRTTPPRRPPRRRPGPPPAGCPRPAPRRSGTTRSGAVGEVLDAEEHVHHEVAEEPGGDADHHEHAPEARRQHLDVVPEVGLLGRASVGRQAVGDAGRRPAHPRTPAGAPTPLPRAPRRVAHRSGDSRAGPVTGRGTGSTRVSLPRSPTGAAAIARRPRVSPSCIVPAGEAWWIAGVERWGVAAGLPRTGLPRTGLPWASPLPARSTQRVRSGQSTHGWHSAHGNCDVRP